MTHIHPDALKHHRKKHGLQQTDLARASRVSAKQISRLEKGNQLNRCNTSTLARLAAALKVKESDLAQEPKHPEADLEGLGYRRAYVVLSHQDQMHYRFLEKRYRVKPGAILRAAPVLFAALAEISLSERRERLEALEALLSEIPSDLTPHLADVQNGLFRAGEGIWWERASIAAHDLSGEKLPDEAWSESYEGSGDLFVDFIDNTLRRLAPDILGPEDDRAAGSVSGISVDLFGPELERLTGGDDLARLIIKRGDVAPKDIPSELMGEDNQAARIAWIQARCSEETRKAHAEADFLI
jgi:transcriptional regulator with XRE-family HTH domain